MNDRGGSRWHPWMTALVGLVAGAIVISVLPTSTLFVRKDIQAREQHGAERWACPMMDFVGTKPGRCPVCGMQLQKVTAGEIAAEQARRMGVELVTVGSGPATLTIHAYGVAMYDDRTEQAVIARIAGRVVKRYPGSLHRGTLVAAADPLIDLYSPDAFQIQSDLHAAVSLGNEGLVRALSDQLRRANLSDVADAVVAGGVPVDTVTIRSPFAGIVVLDARMGSADALVTVGQELAADMPIVKLEDPESFMVVVQVPEPRMRFLRVGQAADLASDDAGALPDISAAISWIAPEINPELRSREVHLHLRDAHSRLLPGSLVHARVHAALAADGAAADPADASSPGTFVLVPKDAVLSTGVRDVAWRMAERKSDGTQRFELAALDLGQRLEDDTGKDWYVVRRGLTVGDQVAARGVFLIDAQAQLAGSKSLLYPNGAGRPMTGHQH